MRFIEKFKVKTETSTNILKLLETESKKLKLILIKCDLAASSSVVKQFVFSLITCIAEIIVEIIVTISERS